MARVKWVHERLLAWARWRSTPGGTGGLGYPSQSAFARLTPSAQRNEATVPVCDHDAWVLDVAVRTLTEAQQALLGFYYLREFGVKAIAEGYGCSVPAVYARLETIDTALQVALSLQRSAKI